MAQADEAKIIALATEFGFARTSRGAAGGGLHMYIPAAVLHEMGINPDEVAPVLNKRTEGQSIDINAHPYNSEAYGSVIRCDGLGFMQAFKSEELQAANEHRIAAYKAGRIEDIKVLNNEVQEGNGITLKEKPDYCYLVPDDDGGEKQIHVLGVLQNRHPEFMAALRKEEGVRPYSFGQEQVIECHAPLEEVKRAVLIDAINESKKFVEKDGAYFFDLDIKKLSAMGIYLPELLKRLNAEHPEIKAHISEDGSVIRCSPHLISVTLPQYAPQYARPLDTPSLTPREAQLIQAIREEDARLQKTSDKNWAQDQGRGLGGVISPGMIQNSPELRKIFIEQGIGKTSDKDLLNALAEAVPMEKLFQAYLDTPQLTAATQDKQYNFTAIVESINFIYTDNKGVYIKVSDLSAEGIGSQAAISALNALVPGTAQEKPHRSTALGEEVIVCDPDKVIKVREICTSIQQAVQANQQSWGERVAGGASPDTMNDPGLKGFDQGKGGRGGR